MRAAESNIGLSNSDTCARSKRRAVDPTTLKPGDELHHPEPAKNGAPVNLCPKITYADGRELPLNPGGAVRSP